VAFRTLRRPQRWRLRQRPQNRAKSGSGGAKKQQRLQPLQKKLKKLMATLLKGVLMKFRQHHLLLLRQDLGDPPERAAS
jgi:hypothetical protein